MAEEKARSADGKSSHEETHHFFLPVDAPAIGEHADYVKKSTDESREEICRQRLYILSRDEASRSIRMTIYTYVDEEKYRRVDEDR